MSAFQLPLPATPLQRNQQLLPDYCFDHCLYMRVRGHDRGQALPPLRLTRSARSTL